ncbi:unnamed protein product [Phaedon cochleariae]|uniref:Uncharacterized protein n=1 Tax=Phaedon cochleariae TaxID=80249 RepID=A0A9N9SH96_PHACE|nr:unnamed protein product [Phaedon cochleariae]
MSRCEKETRILEREAVLNEITIKKTNAMMEIWKEEEDIIYTYRRRFTAYCYQGTILDPNTGCIKNDLEVPISKTTAREYVENKSCKTGCECSATVCTGSSSDCCLDIRMETYKGPERMGDRYFETAGLARHSCTSRWACIAKTIRAKPIITDVGSSK